MRITVLILLLGVCGFNSRAQKNHFKDAERYFNSGMITRAIESYKKAYLNSKEPYTSKKASKLGTKGYISYQLGMCYKVYREPDQAIQYFERAILLKYGVQNPRVFSEIAGVMKEQGAYGLAKENYIKFYKHTGDHMGKSEAEECDMSVQMIKNPTRYQMTEAVALNTDFYEFAPFFANGKYDALFFTSNRPGNAVSDDNYILGGLNKDIWISSRDKKGHWGQPVLLGETVNSQHDEGAVAVDRRGTKMYFTRCVYDGEISRGCDIYSVVKRGREWSRAERLAFKPEGADSLVVRHPCLDKEGNTMVFSANLPGGEGGYDLWYTIFNKRTKSWSIPINLGKSVNSVGNEVFPHIRDNGQLYFASDGYPGMGGLDVFQCEGNNPISWDNPENMGAPINSNADDFGIIFEGMAERGFITSNRKWRTKDDLWQFNLPAKRFTLECIVRDSKTKEPIEGVDVKMINDKGIQVELKTDENGHVFVDKAHGKDAILEGGNYTLHVSKENEFFKAKGGFSTMNERNSKAFVFEFFMEGSTVGDVFKLPVMRYDFEKWELQVNGEVNSKDSLDVLYKRLLENPTMIVELRAHTDCRGENNFNKHLSFKRAESCVDYLVNVKGIAPERIIPIGMGEEDPLPGMKCNDIKRMISEEERDAAHQNNRRTDCKIVSWDFIPKDK